MSSSSAKLVSHGSIYLLGNILRRMVSFIMLPIYTTYLTPEHYGTLELLSMVLDFAGIIFGLRLGEAVFRFYFATDDERERREVISTALLLVAALNLVAIGIIFAGASPIAHAVFGGPGHARQLALFSFTLVFQSLTEGVLGYVRVLQRPWLYVGFSMLKLMVQLALNIYFVVALQLAVDGVIYGALLSNVVVTVPLLWFAFSHTGVAFSRTKAVAITKFSIPMVITSVISFYITFGDRYFLRVFGGGLEAVGVYSLGYRFGYLLGFIVGDPFFGIWSTERYLAIKQPDARRRITSAFTMLNIALVVVMAGIALFIPDVLRIMASPEFWGAAIIVPIIMVAYVFQSWTSFSNLGILLEGRTREIAYGTVLAAIVITGGYLLLIPRFGGVGAAIATVIAYAVRLAWVSWRAEKYYPMQLPWSRGFAMLALVAAAWGASLLAPDELWLSIPVRTGIYLAFVLALFRLPGLLTPELRSELLSAARNMLARFQRRRAVPDAPPSSESDHTVPL